MKRCILTFYGAIIINLAFGQVTTQEYRDLIAKGMAMYQEKDYKGAAFSFSSAFKANDWKALPDDRYNAACLWAMSDYPDSAFFNLELIAKNSTFNDYNQLSSDSDLKSLHKDKRWKPLLEIVKQNKVKADAKLNKPLAQKLETIYFIDQNNRPKTDSIAQKYGYNSKELANFWKAIHANDSIDLLEVEKILDQYGWLGADVVGNKGNSALFLVIQHSNLKTQEKYLPMMTEAVTKGNAHPQDLALLIDRIEIRNGRPQIYGSQVSMKDGKYRFDPIIDEANVNKRREEVGLDPIETYAKHFNIDYKLSTR